MDPNANLARQQELLPRVKTDSYARYEMYDLRVALRDWLSDGGFLPAWEKHPEASEAFQKWIR